MSLANDVVQSILATAFDGESLYTVFGCEPALCWFRWSASDALVAALAAAGVNGKDAVLNFVSNALDSYVWPRRDSPAGPCVFTFVSEAPSPEHGIDAILGSSDSRLPGKELHIYCLRPADLQLDKLTANGVREFCERFKWRCLAMQQRDDRVSLGPNSSPMSGIATLAAGLLAALNAPEGAAAKTPHVSLFHREWEKSAPECLVFGDDIESNVCVVSERLLKTYGDGRERLFVTTTTFSGIASMGWLHDSSEQQFSDAERAVFADRLALLAVYREQRALYAADPWALVVDWLNLERSLTDDSHRWRALAKARIFVGVVALGALRDASFGQDILKRATTKGDAAEQIVRLVASRRRMAAVAAKFDALIADAWVRRRFSLTAAYSRSVDAVTLTIDEENVGFDRLRMVFEAYHAQTNGHCKYLIEQISNASILPFMFPALEYRANQLEFVAELSKPAIEDDDGEVAWAGYPFVEMYRCESASMHRASEHERRLLADAIENRLFRDAPRSHLVAAGTSNFARCLLTDWPVEELLFEP